MTSVVAGLQSRGNHNRDCNEIVNDWGRAQNQKKMCKLFFFSKMLVVKGKRKMKKKKKNNPVQFNFKMEETRAC